MMNFGGLDGQYASLEGADFVVIPVPYDLTSSYEPGSRRGPSAMLDASVQLELYDEELCRETFRAGIHTFPYMEPDARGPEQMVDKIHRAVSGVTALEKIPVILGGEHTLAIGAVRAMREQYPGISVLQFDAHADMRDTYQESRYSHACVGRRIWEICPLVQAGVRSMSAECASFIDAKGIRVCPPGIGEDSETWREIIREHLTDDVYVTVDLDVLDPSIMPATGTPEPGGLSWTDILHLIRTVTERCTVRGFDIVELAPIPGMIAPDFTAAKLAYRIMGYIDARYPRGADRQAGTVP